MNNKITSAVVMIVIVGSLMGFVLSMYTIDETEQAIVTQLGKWVKTVQEPGLNFKIPFIQTVHKFERRVLEYDAAAAKVITRDKKHLLLDNYARWRIVDPLKFYQTVGNEFGAQSRLDDIVFSEIREELARHEMLEIISVNREKLMETVAAKCNETASQYGIEVIDVRIKRADLPPGDVITSVYLRMRAERERIAKKYRSEGTEEAVKIQAQTDKEKVILLAESKMIAEKTRGEGDAGAIKIYAEAYEEDPEFYAFIRTLEAYETSLGKDTTIVLPGDSEFFQYLAPGKK